MTTSPAPLRVLVLALAVQLTGACGETQSPRQPEPEAPGPSTEAQLESFYGDHGGRAAFAPSTLAALEALLLGEEDVDRGDLDSAAARVEAVFAASPYESDAWGVPAPAGLNIGDPVAYYGLRMLEHIVAAGPLQSTGTLQMTAIVATCATVTRPTLPDLLPETVELAIDPEILADDAQVLRESTNLFRHWVRAITGGLEVELVVVAQSTCATVDYTDDGSVIVSYPDTAAMVDGLPRDVANATDFFWVVAPSGVPGDGSGFGRHFITGGMGGIDSRPLFLSDDGWFVRKPEHLGRGRYDVIERRAYLPQWFQHEFMHHLFARWPEFALEATGHQWFDRSTWPDDFEGRFEPDYYAEAINKRLLSAEPSLAEGLRGLEFADVEELGLPSLVGRYRREPVDNGWHVVDVALAGSALVWSNEAGVSWSLVLVGGELRAAADSPYGESPVAIETAADGVAALWFNGERYARGD